VLNSDGVTMAEVARELGMSRPTLYRKRAQFNIQVPRERA
jgi:transcriptional regulator of acetoin/glycerol metabolism